jgi:LPXTG-motif cell wall-anchored protein
MHPKRAASIFGALAAVGTGVTVTGGTAHAAPYVPCPPFLANSTDLHSTDVATPTDLSPWMQACLPHHGFRHRHHHHHCDLCPIGHGRHRRITHHLVDEPLRGPAEHTVLPETGAAAAAALGLIGTTVLSIGGLITAGRHRRARW